MISDKVNPLLQCVSEGLPEDEEDEEKEYHLCANSEIPEIIHQNEHATQRRIPPLQQHISLLEDGVKRSKTEGHPHYTDNIVASFLGHSTSNTIVSEHDFSGTLSRGHRPDFRLGYPASSAWASSGYRSIPAQLTPSYPAPHIVARSQQSALWRFPYEYPSTRQGRQSVTTAANATSSNSSIEPIRYSNSSPIPSNHSLSATPIGPS